MRILMWFTLGFGACCALMSYCPELGLLGGIFLLAAAAAILAVRLFAGKLLRRCLLVVIGGAVALCWNYGYSRLYLRDAMELDGQTVHLRATASDFSYDTDYGIAVEGHLQINGKRYSVKLYLDDTAPVSPGDTVEGSFRVRYTGVGAEREPTYHRGEGMFLLAYPAGDSTVIPAAEPSWRYTPAYLRRAINDLLENAFPADAVAFAKGLLLGDSSEFDYETETAFSVSGIRHVVAVSGLHVAILFSIVCFLTGNHRFLRVLVAVPVLVLFAAMAGFTPSVVRACVMQILMLLSLMVKREYDAGTGLSFAALVMLLYNPQTIASVSFQLSVASVAGIFLFSGKANRRILVWMQVGKGKSLINSLLRWLAGGISVTLSAMVFTMPLCAWYFGSVSLVSIVTNLLTLWVITYIFCGIVLACFLGLLWQPAAAALGWLLAWPIRYVLGVSRLLAKLPFAAVYTESIYIVLWLGVCYLLFGLFLMAKKKQPAVYCCCAALTLLIALLASWVEPAVQNYRLTVLDVGQGQCILLQSERKTYMIDCGGEYGESVADLAAQTLLSQGITSLDGLILSHYDADHVNGVEYLLTRISAKTVFLPAMTDDEGLDSRLVESQNTIRVTQNIRLRFGDAVLDIFGSENMLSSNESSLCVLFQREECAILITGDRSTEGELELLRTAQLPQVDYLIAGHHGAATSTGWLLLRSVEPDTVIISVGEDNRYGHPASSLLQMLAELGCRIRRTDLEGTITIWG